MIIFIIKNQLYKYNYIYNKKSICEYDYENKQQFNLIYLFNIRVKDANDTPKTIPNIIESSKLEVRFG